MFGVFLLLLLLTNCVTAEVVITVSRPGGELQKYNHRTSCVCVSAVCACVRMCGKGCVVWCRRCCSTAFWLLFGFVRSGC